MDDNAQEQSGSRKSATVFDALDIVEGSHKANLWWKSRPNKTNFWRWVVAYVLFAVPAAAFFIALLLNIIAEGSCCCLVSA